MPEKMKRAEQRDTEKAAENQKRNRPEIELDDLDDSGAAQGGGTHYAFVKFEANGTT